MRVYERKVTCDHERKQAAAHYSISALFLLWLFWLQSIVCSFGFLMMGLLFFSLSLSCSIFPVCLVFSLPFSPSYCICLRFFVYLFVFPLSFSHPFSSFCSLINERYRIMIKLKRISRIIRIIGRDRRVFTERVVK